MPRMCRASGRSLSPCFPPLVRNADTPSVPAECCHLRRANLSCHFRRRVSGGLRFVVMRRRSTNPLLGDPTTTTQKPLSKHSPAVSRSTSRKEHTRMRPRIYLTTRRTSSNVMPVDAAVGTLHASLVTRARYAPNARRGSSSGGAHAQPSAAISETPLLQLSSAYSPSSSYGSS